jgi:hypothetical protein
LSSLVGCLLYFTGVYRLSRLLFGDRWSGLLAVAVLTTPPLVFDFMVASRGYGMALAFLVWAIYCSVSYWTRGRESRWLFRAGVCAGLSIAANLTMLVPVVALGIALLVLAIRYGGWWRVIDGYAGPAIVTAFAFVVLPLLRATRDNFYYGTQTIRESLETIVAGWLVNAPERWPWTWLYGSLELIVYVAVPALFFSLCAIVVLTAARTFRDMPMPYRSLPLLLIGGTLALSVLIVVALHHAAGVKYPFGRTGLYFIPLFLLTLLLAAKSARIGAARKGLYALAGVLLVIQIIQSDVRYFQEWRYDAATAKLVRRMSEDRQARGGPESTHLVISELLRPTISYYFKRRRIDWVREITDVDPTGANSGDYFILSSEHANLVERLGLESIFSDRISGAVLARGRAQ